MTKKNLVAVLILFTIAVISCCTFALAYEAEEISENEVMVVSTDELISSDSLSIGFLNGSSFISGDTMKVKITTSLNTDKLTSEEKELKYKISFNSRYYSVVPTIKVSTDSNSENIQQSINCKDVSEIDLKTEKNKTVISFVWSVDVSKLILDCNIKDKNASQRMNFGIFDSEDKSLCEHSGSIINIIVEPPSAPGIEAKVSGQKVSAKKWISADTVDVAFTKGSAFDIKEYKYTLSGATTSDGEKTINSGDSFKISNEGKTTIKAKLIDVKDKESVYSTNEIKIDRTKPKITISATEAGKGAVTSVTVNAVDPSENANEISGLNVYLLRYFWSTEDIAEQELVREKFTKVSNMYHPGNPIPLTTESGKHYLYVCAEDNAGNFVAEKSEFTIVVDKTKPTINVTPKRK